MAPVQPIRISTIVEKIENQIDEHVENGEHLLVPKKKILTNAQKIADFFGEYDRYTKEKCLVNGGDGYLDQNEIKLADKLLRQRLEIYVERDLGENQFDFDLEKGTLNINADLFIQGITDEEELNYIDQLSTNLGITDQTSVTILLQTCQDNSEYCITMNLEELNQNREELNQDLENCLLNDAEVSDDLTNTILFQSVTAAFFKNIQSTSANLINDNFVDADNTFVNNMGAIYYINDEGNTNYENGSLNAFNNLNIWLGNESLSLSAPSDIANDALNRLLDTSKQGTWTVGEEELSTEELIERTIERLENNGCEDFIPENLRRDELE